MVHSPLCDPTNAGVVYDVPRPRFDVLPLDPRQGGLYKALKSDVTKCVCIGAGAEKSSGLVSAIVPFDADFGQLHEKPCRTSQPHTVALSSKLPAKKNLGLSAFMHASNQFIAASRQTQPNQGFCAESLRAARAAFKALYDNTKDKRALKDRFDIEHIEAKQALVTASPSTDGVVVDTKVDSYACA